MKVLWMGVCLLVNSRKVVFTLPHYFLFACSFVHQTQFIATKRKKLKVHQTIISYQAPVRVVRAA